MPYTPPAQLSPAASKSTSPAPTRSQSYLDNHHLLEVNGGLTPSDRPTLPRSTSSSSYLSKHRRSPSFAKDEDVPQTPEEETYDAETAGDGETNQVAFLENGTIDPNGSLRQSPPPVSNPLIPTGATMSPPDSTHNSSDEEEHVQARGRQLENLEELQKAISLIEQRRESSPNRRPDAKRPDEILRARLTLEGQLPLASDNHPEVPPNSTNSSRPPLSREARKISHSRSSSELVRLDGTKSMSHSPNHYSRESSSDDDSEGGRSRPTMVRKKSGELVRPALRPPSAKRRPSSMPGTPTYSKAVHFDSHLEHVRHFLQVDRPAAVSAGSSPVEAYESEQEFPFSGAGEDGHSRSPPYEWEIRLTNFSDSAEARKHEPVRVEKIYLSSDNRNLICNIAVQNLAFQKLVVARFTFDYWKTTSEIVAEYNTDVRRRQNDGCDRFNFCLKLADQANLENRTLFFCVKYTVNGQDHWDNNNSMNYQVDFSKKARPRKTQAKAPNGLPKSRLSPNGVERPKSMPVSFDDFATGFENFGTQVQPPAALMGESPIKLKAPRSRVTIIPDAPTRKPTASARAFGNRYDFGASLSAAIQNATTILGEQSGLSFRPDAKQSSREVPAVKEDGPTPGQVSNALAAGSLASRQATLISEKPPLQSQSYKELVDKYCFVGTTQPKVAEAKSVVKS